MINGGDRATELATRATDVAARLDVLYARRRELSLAAAENDRTALKQIESIDAEASKLLAQQATLTDAVRLAEEQDRARVAGRGAADRQKHLAEAAKIASAALKVSAEIDGQLVALTRAFERRAKLLAELSRTGCLLGPHVSQRYLSKTAGSAAARAAGLDRFINIEHVAPAHQRTLSETSSVLRNELTLPDQTSSPPPPQPSPRFRLFGGQ